MSHTLPQAILCDLDGTLVDSAPDIAIAVNETLKSLGHAAVDHAYARQWVGGGARRLIQRMFAHLDNSNEHDIDEQRVDTGLDYFLKHYAQTCTQQTQCYPGVIEALTEWEEKGILLACVTNKPGQFTQPVLDYCGLSGFFPVVVSGDSLPVKKPDPQPLLFACEQLGVVAERALMLGDSRADVDAARAAGMPVACVPYGYHRGESMADLKPDFVVEDLRQLLACID